MFVLVLVGLVGAMGVVNADSPDYDVLYVEVNDYPVNLADNRVLDIERGENLDLTVVIEAANSINGGSLDDVRIKAEIEGYEYGDIEDRTSIFEVEEGLTYYKRLSLAIPEDIDASETYTLRVEVSDKDNEEVWEFTLHVDEQRHKLNIYDIIVRPGTSVESGRPLFVDVRVENLGSKKENDIKVTAAIPELGVSDSRYIDELVPVEGCSAFDCDDNEETSESSGDLFLRVPQSAKTGAYELVVEVSYDRGHEIIRAVTLVNIDGVASGNAGELNAIVSIDTTTRQIVQGEEVGYRIMVANLGNEQQVLTATVNGVESWATTRVTPGFLTLAPGQTGELLVYLKANDNIDAGQRAFTVSITSGNSVGVKTLNLNADVVAGKNSFDVAKDVLIGVFIVLIVILIILAIVLVVKKLSTGNEPLEPASEGQSYY